MSKASYPFSIPVTKEVKNRLFFTEREDFPFPNLIEIQLDSYKRFLEEGIKELLEEINPIEDFTGKKLSLHFISHEIEKPKYTPEQARRKNVTFEALVKARVQLLNKETGEVKEQDVYLGAIPMMTDRGSFVVNGIERVVVNQLVRASGAFITKSPSFRGKYNVKIIPRRGAWLEFETDKKGVIYAKIDRKRRFPMTQMLRIFGLDTDNKIRKQFEHVTKGSKLDIIEATLEKDPAKTEMDAYQSIYKKIRPGDLATPDNAKSLVDSLFFDYKRYDMGPVARYKMNKKFGFDTPDSIETRVLQKEDFFKVVEHLIRVTNGEIKPDDIDHLSNRRVRAVGELVQNKYRIGLLRMERIIRDRMTVMELDQLTPMQLINARPVTAAMKEHFASSQLSQFMDQTNPLAELEHKRRLSAMGPGGLSRERASFDVRDVHESHYGRICPVATPEGPNIGLVLHLASYSKVNRFGFIETPFRAVKHSIKLDKKAEETLKGRILNEEIKGVGKIGDAFDAKMTKALLASKLKEVQVFAYVDNNDVTYFDADSEQPLFIAEANSEVDENGNFTHGNVGVRHEGEPTYMSVKRLTHIDVSPKQIFSEGVALIPFIEHDDNTRAIMGANMQRQAVPLLSTDAPIVGTGLEEMVARESGQVVLAEDDGEVVYADAREVRVTYKKGKQKIYAADIFKRSNQTTCIHMKTRVVVGQKLQKGDVIFDGSAVEKGELALGRNLTVAYMTWKGYNYEDAIIISSGVIHNGDFDSVHIEEYVVDIRDTKLGPEIMTRDIPNVGETRLKDLDEEGIIRIGAFAKEGDILVGKITPKGESDLTPEERLLQAIFGDMAKDVKDTSLRLPGGEGGKVIDVQILSREQGDDLQTSVLKQVRIMVAQKRRMEVGDKMAGRHGNKGVVSRIVAREDMPFLEDGTPVDIILNPLGVPGRMNIGQLLEAHLGWAAKSFGIKVATPALNGIRLDTIQQFLKEAKLSEDGKVQLYDGMTGEPFSRKTVVGITYMLKLSHLVADKIHARSVGPYSLVTQQPLGGKAQHGGQRFGEMEVWALEAYGAAYVLQEMLTIKSDDIQGRSRAYEDIVKGQPVREPSIPESFNVLVRELQALCLHVELLSNYSEEDDAQVSLELSAEGEVEGEEFEEVEKNQIAELQESETDADVETETAGEDPYEMEESDDVVEDAVA
ncbi:DNA-directed RNA polymerase subunit beta [Candidatus Peregrinibacteria bacterium]|nr:MAG: DNA-directed RNA polymerase subunit beta [Candidatus Peregrinibacteria bacterium]